MNWERNAIFYHIYPLGFCGAEDLNNFKLEPIPKINKVAQWKDHLKNLGVTALYIGPIFESTKHGYDTADYLKIDRRLGTNEDFKAVCSTLHESGIRVVLDGVFNHVGRDFWAFKDVQLNRENSKYKDWFHINFRANSNYNDCFSYVGWEGHYDLVELNLSNVEVKNHIFSAISSWVSEFDIDGLRLDVAYSLDKAFLKELSSFCKSLKPDFFILGEMIHGDYNTIVGEGLLDSATNYECYKGIFSSFNSENMFEIEYSLNRQFGKGGIYENLPLYSFVENHDVIRLASVLTNPNHLKLAYGLLLTMPGIPSIYYGGEWGILGDNSKGDAALRPALELSSLKDNELTKFISSLIDIRKNSKALCVGAYKKEHLTNHQYIFSREFEGEKIIIAINIENKPYAVNYKFSEKKATDLLTKKEYKLQDKLILDPYSIYILKI